MNECMLLIYMWSHLVLIFQASETVNSLQEERISESFFNLQNHGRDSVVNEKISTGNE